MLIIRRPILFTIFIVIVLSYNISAQSSIAFRHLSQKDGLSQSSVFTITQDETGFMWFGTRDGLNKYDGYNFKAYKNREALIAFF